MFFLLLAGRKKKKLIKAVDLKKSYRKLEVLKGISFEVKKGSVFGFIGNNGAGKTTTMNILIAVISE